MALPGEKAALDVLYSPFSTSMDKADAALKLREVDEVRRHNAERDREYRARRARQADEDVFRELVREANAMLGLDVDPASEWGDWRRRVDAALHETPERS